MNLFFKILPGYLKYKVTAKDASVAAGKIMNEFSDAIFDTYVKDKNKFEFCVQAFHNKRLVSMLLENGVEIESKKMFGAVSALNHLKKRIGIVIGSMLIVFAMFLKKDLLIDVRVSGNKTIADEEITETLSELGLKPGRIIDKESIVKISNRFLINSEKISWMSINMSGNVAFVEVMEMDVADESDNKQSSMEGITSKYDCVVILSKATSGESVVKSGDTVKKGQLLISPIVQGKDGSEYIVGAKGEVLGKTYEYFTLVMPKQHTRNVFTGKIKKENTVNTFDIRFKNNIFHSPDYQKYIIRKIGYKVKKENGIELPVYISGVEKYEYTSETKILTDDEIRHMAYSKMYTAIAERLGESELLSVSFSEEISDEYYVLECTVECVRNVTDIM